MFKHKPDSDQELFDCIVIAYLVQTWQFKEVLIFTLNLTNQCEVLGHDLYPISAQV